MDNQEPDNDQIQEEVQDKWANLREFSKLGGRKPIKNLFIEFAETAEEKENAKYSFEEFHQIFLEEKDMTEYKAAIRCVGTWSEWLRFKEQWPLLRNSIEKWKDELEVKMQSDAMTKLLSLVTCKSDQTAANVCKFLVQSGYNKREGAGRPSKQEMAKQAKELARIAADTDEEEQRILSLVVGGKGGKS